MGPIPTTAIRAGSVSCSNKVSVVNSRSPRLCHAEGTIGRDPVAIIILRARSSCPFTSSLSGASRRARPEIARSPNSSVVFRVLATKSSRNRRTRCNAAEISSVRWPAPRIPNSSKVSRRWKAFAASINNLDGMQPTRAHTVPQGPSLIMTKRCVRFLTSRSAARPALPAPTIITSSISFIAPSSGLISPPPYQGTLCPSNA